MAKSKDKKTQERKRRFKQAAEKLKLQIEQKKSTHARDFPYCKDDPWKRKAVCKRCHCVLNDCDPFSKNGEFWHPKEDKEGKPHWCKNAGLCFNVQSLDLEPFLKKKVRRYNKRNNGRL